MHPRRAEHHIGLNAVQISLAHMKHRALRFQLQYLGIQFLPRGLVAGQRADAIRKQHPDQRPVADTDAQYSYFLIL